MYHTGNVKGCTMFIAILLASSLIAGHLGTQRFDPRERYEAPARVRVSQGVMRTLMRNQAVPNYPQEAKRKGIQGIVLLSLAVDEKGYPSDIKVVSGHPLLVPITVEAVKRLRFRPYYLNGEAVPIQGYVSYMFKCPPNDRATVSLGPSQ
jgi:TonB family protein